MRASTKLLLLMGRGMNPYVLPNQVFQHSFRGIAGDSTYLIDESNRWLLAADRSGNSAVNGLVTNGVSGNNASFPALPPFGTGNFTLSAKITPFSIASDMAVFGSPTGGVYWHIIGGFGNLNLVKDGGASTAASAFALVPFTPRVISYTRSGTTGTFYIDGVAANAITDSNDYTAGISFVGVTAAGARYNGFCQWARVYASALDATQIAADAAGTQQADCIFDARFDLAAKLASSLTESSVNAATVTINTSGDNGARICGARDIGQTTQAKQFLTSSVSGYLQAVSDNSNDFVATPLFSLPQPWWMHIVMAQKSWTIDEVLVDGRVSDSAQLYQDTTTPTLTTYAGEVGPSTTAVPVDTKVVIGMIFNGANSYIQVNGGTPVQGDAGTVAANGITLAARANGLSNGHLSFYEQIGFSGTPSLAYFNAIQRALMRTNGVA